MPRHPDAGQQAPLIAVIEAPGGAGAAATVDLARSLAAATSEPAGVVLADLTLDAPQRALHGLDPDAPGIVKIAAAARFGSPDRTEVASAAQVTGTYRLVPGLRRHQDWIRIGPRPAATAIDAIRDHAALVVAPVDRDLEGEPETGSPDVEDRNALSRAAVRVADLVVVVAAPDRAGRIGLVPVLAEVAAFGVPPSRTLALLAGADGHPATAIGPGIAGGQHVRRLPWGARAEERLGSTIWAQLRILAPNEAARDGVTDGPERIAPGTLGSWDQDVAGWITPSTPQQP